VVTGEKNIPTVAHACRKRRLKWVLGPPGWGLDERLATNLCKTVSAEKTQTIETGGLSRQTKQGLRTRDGNYKIGTWNIRSLLQPGKMQDVAEKIIKYNVDIAAVQEIRWRDTGQICKMRYSFYYSGSLNRQGYKGVGFYVTKHQ
jgi:hypothetical protein